MPSTCGLHGHGLAAIVQGECVARARLQRQTGNVENPRDDIGHAAGDVVFDFLLLVCFQIVFIQHGFAARIVVGNDRVAPVRAFLDVLHQLGGTQALFIEVRFETVLHAVEQGNHSAGIGGNGHVFCAPARSMRTVAVPAVKKRHSPS